MPSALSEDGSRKMVYNHRAHMKQIVSEHNGHSEATRLFQMMQTGAHANLSKFDSG